ncbi:MAG TPA: hypothetical protein HPP56_04480 [Nitrospirae bacterium]|nr:hypothetical protein [Nitrospirota bacterium]
MPIAKVPQGFFYKMSYKIFHQSFLLDFVKFSVLSLILSYFALVDFTVMIIGQPINPYLSLIIF